jgi:hypothetical protein
MTRTTAPPNLAHLGLPPIPRGDCASRILPDLSLAGTRSTELSTLEHCPLGSSPPEPCRRPPYPDPRSPS